MTIATGSQGLAADVNAILPSGCIVFWSGSIVSIPSGFYLCNGSNGTPDLRDKFIVGAGSTYAVNANGGSLTTAATGATERYSTSGTPNTITPNHTHTFLPPYYSLAYIMKA
jgi:hypothetical protein